MIPTLHNRTEVPRSPAPPDFDNLLAVLDKRKPARPTLFEFFLNDALLMRLARETRIPPAGIEFSRLWLRGFLNAGYDYVTVPSFHLNAFDFPAGEREHASSVNMNEGGLIRDRATFDAYEWKDPDAGNYSMLAELKNDLPAGMKLIASGPGGVLENAMSLVGYEPLCYMIIDDETLVSDIFEAIGSRLVRYYRNCLKYDTVGAIIGNDDWGFKSQTMLSPDQMRKYVFPWHKQIVADAHAAGKHAILHSCGRLDSVMDDIIDDIGYDAKHSYEDGILPVEEAYRQYHDRIAIVGGLDVDFVCRASPAEVYERSRRMLDIAAEDGAYALGTGNSVPDYVPDENYFAMIKAVIEQR